MDASRRRAVLVTGASSGIGKATVLHLARSGFHVFGSVRKDADADALRTEHAAITPIMLDVTDAASIQRAVTAVSAEVDGLDGLVNNAGVGIAIPLEYVPLDVVRRHFEIDVFGQLAVTQAFLPMIRRRRGRIINMGSVGSHIAIPFGGVLGACKSALQAMNDALRLELHASGIDVCLIEPGSISTPAVDKVFGDVERTIASLPIDGQTRYGAMLRELARRGYKREIAGSPPEVVARIVEEALTARRPRAHYPVGRDARLLITLPRVLPEGLLDRLRYRLFGMPGRAKPAH